MPSALLRSSELTATFIARRATARTRDMSAVRPNSLARCTCGLTCLARRRRSPALVGSGLLRRNNTLDVLEFLVPVQEIIDTQQSQHKQRENDHDQREMH